MAPWMRSTNAHPPVPLLPPVSPTDAADSSSTTQPLSEWAETILALQAVGVDNVSTQTTSSTGTTTQRLPAKAYPTTPLRRYNGHTRLENSVLTSSPPGSSQQRKHSHGLSWSSHTRDDLFDTLLSSLDHIPESSVERTRASLDSRPVTRSGITPSRSSPMSQSTTHRPHGHARGHSSSLSAVPSSPLSNAAGVTAANILHGSSERPDVKHTMAGRTRHTKKGSDATDAQPASRPAEREYRSATHESESILSKGRPVPPMHPDSDAAAPEPSVPSGPGPKKETSRRFGGSVKQKTSNPRPEHKDIARATSMRTLQPQQSTDSAASTPSKQAFAPDEKRGFFKRVFGSSASRMNLNSPDSLASPASPALPSQSSQKRDPSPNGGTARELSKKTSAFFRRQKNHTTATTEIPSIPPLHPTTNVNADSPARSSLYTAMNPFLADSPSPSPLRMNARPAANDMTTNHKRPDSSAASENTEDPDYFYNGYVVQTPDLPARSLSQVTDPRRPSEIAGHLQIRNSSVASSSHLMPSRSGSHAEPLMLMSTVSSVYSTDLTSPDMAHGQEDASDNDMRPLSSKGGIQHGLIVNTSSPHMGAREFVVSRNANGDTELTQVRPITPTTELDDEELVTPKAKETFVSSTALSGPTTPAGTTQAADARDLGNSDRHTTSSPLEPASAIPDFQSARVQNAASPCPDSTRNMSTTSTGTALTSATAIVEGPTQEDRDRALSIYEGSEEHVPRDQAATYLGERRAANINTLKAFMGLFNFTEQTILGGVRMLCNRVHLKAESQQVDRILDCFASRWIHCNPEHGFKLKDVVHTICYSLMLLNTDMHMADIESKMTRAQFVKNTLPTIKRVVAEAPTDDTGMPNSAARPEMHWQDSAVTMSSSSTKRRMSTDSHRPTLTKRMSWSLGLGRPEDMIPQVSQISQVPNSGSTALVSEQFDGKPTEWHYELEQILKSFFTAIKNDALPLNQGPAVRRPNSIKSMRSMAPSEMSVRSRRTDMMPGRWHMNRARSKFYAASAMGSSRTSFDDGSSMFSPTASSTWSKFSLGKALTGQSTDTLATNMGPDQSFPQNIGFANALSQTIAREEGLEDDSMSINPQKFLLEDDSLELAGAPWAKEGIVKHKHHLETTEKRAKIRDWSECFAVIERGYLRMFSFNSKGGKSGSLGVRKSTMHRPKAPSIAPNVVGGGNWMQNAEKLGSFLLRQTIASALPPPGYSKARPHVWALSLPNGAVHLFQVGTPEIAKEFVDTANYWSARLSKEPLAGSVENTEYGWSENIMLPSMIHPALAAAATGQDSDAPPTRGHSASNSVSHPRRMSVARSIRGSIDYTGLTGRHHGRPGDKAHLEDWKPPAQSMMASQLMEVDQLQALTDYVASVEAELGKHNELRSNLANAFSPRSSNLSRATTNWEAKSSYLLREIVKFSTYIDALNNAGKERTRIDAEREEREAEKAERERKKRETAAAAAEEEEEEERTRSTAEEEKVRDIAEEDEQTRATAEEQQARDKAGVAVDTALVVEGEA